MRIESTIKDLLELREKQEDTRAINTAITSLRMWSTLIDNIEKLDLYDDEPGVDCKVLLFDVIKTIDICKDAINKV